jgi:hypothetical protein
MLVCDGATMHDACLVTFRVPTHLERVERVVLKVYGQLFDVRVLQLLAHSCERGLRRHPRECRVLKEKKRTNERKSAYMHTCMDEHSNTKQPPTTRRE